MEEFRGSGHKSKYGPGAGDQKRAGGNGDQEGGSQGGADKKKTMVKLEAKVGLVKQVTRVELEAKVGLAVMVTRAELENRDSWVTEARADTMINWHG